MGTDKALLPVDGVPLVEIVTRRLEAWFEAVWISGAENTRFDFLDVPVVSDLTPGRGPLMGGYTPRSSGRRSSRCSCRRATCRVR